MPRLFAFREDRFGFQFEIGERALLGRSPECDLILFDRATSRKHAEIVPGDEGWVLVDMGSTNGTLHNEVRVNGQAALKVNDEIRVGQEIFLFDPDLDVAIGSEGSVLIAGEVEAEPDGLVKGKPDTDVTRLDRSCLAPLFQISLALASRPRKRRVLKQTAYALSKLFGATAVALLWPESTATKRLTALLSRPAGRRLVLPRPMVDLVGTRKTPVIWPYTISSLNFVRGERQLALGEDSAMAVPLQAHGDNVGVLYVESDKRTFTPKDLNFLTALGHLVAAGLVNASLIGQLDTIIAREDHEENNSGGLVGGDHQIKALLGTALQIAGTDARVLLSGETGTGKEALARRIHNQSARRRGPFIPVNCSAYAPGQIEATLFGEDSGAFSEEGTPGLLEQAEGGSLFLRHVDRLPLSAQAELLRALEEGVSYRLGSTTPRPIDLRVMSSTTQDLDEMVADGEFREDFYQRLCEVNLTMPPLREIQGDIGVLARHFLGRAAEELGVSVPELDPAAGDCLLSYPWPGNVSELKNTAERMVMFAVKDRVVLDDLNPEIRYSSDAFSSTSGIPASETLADAERILIRRALARSQNDVQLAASMLGLDPKELTEKIKQYNIDL
jgi:DNA-binding NtrC family response regulator/pSer/pThr/pTyr-binding forkhead associated (FHA) protein